MRLVWSPQIPRIAVVDRHSRELGIAFFEYCLQVPANRIGYGEFSAGQLKIIQEIITLVVFAAFATLYLGDPVTWRYAGAFVCILGAVAFMFVGRA